MHGVGYHFKLAHVDYRLPQVTPCHYHCNQFAFCLKNCSPSVFITNEHFLRLEGGIVVCVLIVVVVVSKQKTLGME